MLHFLSYREIGSINALVNNRCESYTGDRRYRSSTECQFHSGTEYGEIKKYYLYPFYSSFIMDETLWVKVSISSRRIEPED